MLTQEIRSMDKSEVISFLEKHRGEIYTHELRALASCEELCREQILSVSVLPLPNDNSNSTYYGLRPGYRGREAYKKYMRSLGNA